MIPDMDNIPNECRVLLQRLRQCDLKEITANPTLMIKLYPIRNPDNKTTIFDEVYSLLNTDLLKKSYKFKVFFFLNTFLSSTKVQAHVIAAYIKRLSRLSLYSKARSLVAILRLINNLLVRHPTLMFLRDKVDERARELELSGSTCTLKLWLDADPFDMRQMKDLEATEAMKSYIWEAMMLRFHPHPKVVKEAKFLGETNVPEMEKDLVEILK